MKVIIADDHQVVRDGLRWMLTTEPNVEIVAEVESGTELLRAVETGVDADVVLLDLRMPDESGFDVLEALPEVAPEVRAIVLSMHDEPSFVRRAIELGAAGYLLKNVDRRELVRAMERAVDGNGYIQGEVSSSVVRGLAGNGNLGAALTPREVEIVQLIANGGENKQIARRMDLSEATVKSYLKNAFARLEVSSRAEAVAVALRLGLID